MPAEDEREDEREQERRLKAERLERFVGPSRQHDEEDIERWRHASDELRGRTLYRLLARGRAMRASIPFRMLEFRPGVILRPRPRAQDDKHE